MEEQNKELKNLCWEIRASLDSLYDNLSTVELGSKGWKKSSRRARVQTLALGKYFKEFRKLSSGLSNNKVITN